MLVKSQVKYIQSLSQKKGREEEGLFIAEGPKLINELLNEPAVRLKQLFALRSWLDQSTGHNDRSGWVEVTEEELGRISLQKAPNQVLAIFHQPEFAAPVHTAGRLTLFLDTVQDPGNMGTILRCADWFGVTQVVCTEDCADIFNPKVVQSTMGSIARVQVVYVRGEEWLRSQSGVPVLAAVLDGKSLYDMPRIQEGIILVGNESKGISASVLSAVPGLQKITIPRKGQAESLNAAVATGIILSHLT